jgi:hypothetical protein
MCDWSFDNQLLPALFFLLSRLVLSIFLSTKQRYSTSLTTLVSSSKYMKRAERLAKYIFLPVPASSTEARHVDIPASLVSQRRIRKAL